MHGYALRACIALGLGPLWQVASSQLYQVLHRLEKRGCVCRSSQAPSAGPSKRVYHVTGKGEEAFWEWAQEPVGTMRNIRVEFAAKLYFLRRQKLGAVSPFIDRQLSELRRVKGRLSSEARTSSDDADLNAAWLTLQLATVDNFSRWLKAHREQLSTDKEKKA